MVETREPPASLSVLNFAAITLKTVTVYANLLAFIVIISNAEKIETAVRNRTEPGDASGPVFCY